MCVSVSDDPSKHERDLKELWRLSADLSEAFVRSLVEPFKSVFSSLADRVPQFSTNNTKPRADLYMYKLLLLL